MHFLLLLMRLILDRLTPHWRDGLKMAARNDGRIEHWRSRPNFWSQWLSLLEEAVKQESPKPKKPLAACTCAPPASPTATS
jgi:hypothetical protein